MSGKNKNKWKENKFPRHKNQKSDFFKNKKIAKIDDTDVNKILVSKEELYGTKNSFEYFIGYNDNDVIRPLCIKVFFRHIMVSASSIYLLLALLIFFYHFHNNLSLYSVSRLCFFDNKLCYSFFYTC